MEDTRIGLAKESASNQEIIGILWYLLAFGQSLDCNGRTIIPCLFSFTSRGYPEI